MQQMCRITGRHRKTGKRYTDDGGFSDKDPDIVEIGTIARQLAGFEAPKLRSRLGDGLLALRNDQQSVARQQNRIGCWNEVVAALSDHRDLDVGEGAGCQFAKFPSGKSLADRNLGHMETL